MLIQENREQIRYNVNRKRGLVPQGSITDCATPSDMLFSQYLGALREPLPFDSETRIKCFQKLGYVHAL